MARTKNPTPENPSDAVDNEAIVEASKTVDEDAQRMAIIDNQFANNLPYDRQRVIDETRFFLGHAASALLEAGNRLIVLKEHESHGEFIEVLEQIGIVPRAAQKMMQAAVKFGNPKWQALADLGKSKLLELMTEDDDDLEVLAEGGTLAEHTLDDIDRMTTRELKEHLRKARENKTKDGDVHETMLKKKDEKINELDKALHRNDAPDWPQEIEEIRINATTQTGSILLAVDKLHLLQDRIAQVPPQRETDTAEDRISSAMCAHYLQSVEQTYSAITQLVIDARELFIGYADTNNEIAANAPATIDKSKDQ